MPSATATRASPDLAEAGATSRPSRFWRAARICRCRRSARPSGAGPAAERVGGLLGSDLQRPHEERRRDLQGVARRSRVRGGLRPIAGKAFKSASTNFASETAASASARVHHRSARRRSARTRRGGASSRRPRRSGRYESAGESAKKPCGASGWATISDCGFRLLRARRIASTSASGIRLSAPPYSPRTGALSSAPRRRADWSGGGDRSDPASRPYQATPGLEARAVRGVEPRDAARPGRSR